MKTFPGSFPGSEFNRMSLEQYGEVWSLTVEFIEAEREAIRNRNG